MQRRAITVRGIVQGVGFRPYVYHLALRYRLNGFVRNQAGVVHIEVEGDSGSLDRFRVSLVSHPPPLAMIEGISCRPVRYRGDSEFRIVESEADSAGDVCISPDVATCGDCLRELLDPRDRRYRYPFLNCTHCGPRLTIVLSAPYDRPRTTMAGFGMCPACRAEYENPTNRRFHAQPTCCPDCGPRLKLRNGRGEEVESSDPLDDFARALIAGRIGALKGLGGYHLACDASNEEAVTELRRRKQREEKPLAIMVADLSQAERFCRVSAAERALLASPRAPIVLLSRRGGSVGRAPNRGVARSVAPGCPHLGVLLPYTPLHHLLVRAVRDVPLVMTSGNRSDEPIAYRDEQAFQQLGDIADLFLVHDRLIQLRCDDSVTRVVGKTEYPIRRSRGYAPRPVVLPRECACPVLAVGGQLKGAFALGRSGSAFLSHHLGDLDHFEAFRAFQRDLRLYEDLVGIHPQVIAHDLHPDYATTGYAQNRAETEGIRTLGVQHHHAHVTSCMAEHGLSGDVLGVAFDGTGFGTDGAIWGGEFLLAGYGGFQRLAHLRYVPLPGGDQAIRQPWRSALSHMIDAGGDPGLFDSIVPATTLRAVRQMIQRRVNSPPTSSAGRLFDAVGVLAGLRGQVRFEAQVAMELEWLAQRGRCDGAYPFAIQQSAESGLFPTREIDTRPLIRAVSDDARRGIDAARIARRFHRTLVEMIGAVCGQLRGDTGVNRVVLSGGVFLNVLLTRETMKRLTRDGFRVYRHRLVPPNDGGLCLGQLAVAAERLHSGARSQADAGTHPPPPEAPVVNGAVAVSRRSTVAAARRPRLVTP